jgi:hypothetical protein
VGETGNKFIIWFFDTFNLKGEGYKKDIIHIAKGDQQEIAEIYTQLEGERDAGKKKDRQTEAEK